jgi:hypothetical protein
VDVYERRWSSVVTSEPDRKIRGQIAATARLQSLGC